jgi:hypothetical protein
MKLHGKQEDVRTELESLVADFVSKGERTRSNGCVVFDNPGEHRMYSGGGEVDNICMEVGRNLSLPVLKIPYYEGSESIPFPVISQLKAVDPRFEENELMKVMLEYTNRGPVVSSGFLLNKALEIIGSNAIVYIGPLEEFESKQYPIQDLILYFLDTSFGIFLVLSTSESYWKELPEKLSTWQKIHSRMAQKSLSNSINPLSTYEEFDDFLDFLVKNGLIDRSKKALSREIWRSLGEDKTYNGIKNRLGGEAFL